MEFGNGDILMLDVGSGSVANFNSMKIPPADLRKFFITHLHTDHQGDLDMFWAQGIPFGRTVVWTNPLAHQYFGQAQETLLGSSLFELFPTEQARRIQAHARPTTAKAEEGCSKHDREMELAQRIYRYRCFSVAIRGSERPQTGLVIRDVTHEKQMQDQLIQAEKLASLGTMVSGMAHEINNPAQAILGMAELIAQEEVAPQVREYASDIVNYARHVGAVVRDFASYARSSSREGATDLDLNERITEAIKMVRRSPHFGEVEVVTDLQPLQPLRARRAEIDQVFVNLAGNAAQAMHGHGRLTLCTWQHGMHICASISDTGCGIPKAALNNIFDPFFTTKDPGKGTGLGLSIVNKIVNKYDGNITVDSEQGRGTTFTIEFPMVTKTQGGV